MKLYLYCKCIEGDERFPEFAVFKKVKDAKSYAEADQRVEIEFGEIKIDMPFQRYMGHKWPSPKKNKYLGYREEWTYKNTGEFGVIHLVPFEISNIGNYIVVRHHAWNGCDFEAVSEATSWKEAKRLALKHVRDEIKCLPKKERADLQYEKGDLVYDDGLEMVQYDILRIVSVDGQIAAKLYSRGGDIPWGWHTKN